MSGSSSFDVEFDSLFCDAYLSVFGLSGECFGEKRVRK
jgi:hypothetical protein